ncbi:MAG: FtsX-like permease family protein [Pirellulales bacterium]
MSFLHVIARSWRQRPGRAILSIVSVATAVAAVLGTGFAQSSVRQGVARLSKQVDKHPSLEIVAVSGDRFALADVPDVSELPGVEGVFPLATRAALARVHGQRFRTVLLGLPSGDEKVAAALDLVEGRAPSAPDDVVLSADVAEGMKAAVNDRLTVITRRGPKSMTVVGLADPSALAQFAPAAGVVMPLSAVQEYFQLSGRVDRLRIVVASREYRDGVLADVAAQLPDELVVQKPADPLETIDTTLQSTELALRLAGALSMAMAAFIILNTVRLNFSERRHDLAVLRVLGATRRQVLGLHLVEGAGLGFAGAALGAPVGWWLGRALAGAMGALLEVDIPAGQISTSEFAGAMALGPAVALLAALVPAIQSRNVPPVEALGDLELRRSEHFPLWATAAGVAAWCLSVLLVALVAVERLAPQWAIPAGLLMLVAFIAVIPAAGRPVLRAIRWLLSPLLKTEGRLASEQLLARSTRTGLTVGVLVVALSAGLGLGTAIVNNVNDVRDWHRRSLSGDVFLTDPAARDDTAASQDRRDITAEVAALPDVRHVVEMRLLSGRANGMPAICVVRDFPPELALPWELSPAEDESLRSRMAEGEVVISNMLARRLDLSVGDAVRLEFQGRTSSPRVAQIVNDYLLGGQVAYLDRVVAEEIVALGPAEFYIVEAAPGVPAGKLVAELEELLAEENILVQSFADMRRQLDGLINSVVAALWSLLAVGFLIGGAAVSNTLVMNVLEQTRELGLLRIIGMTQAQVRKLVFCESLLLGLFGALMGTLGGITTAAVIHVCNEPVLGRSIPFELHPWLLAANAGGCLVIAVVAAWRPGRRAARLDLLAAIAYE